jgi:anti-sigma B factor antagonist
MRVNNKIVPGFDDEKDESLNIRLQRIEDVPGCLVLYLTGCIDTYNCSNFQKRVAKATEAGFTRLILDMAGINYVSSVDIGCYMTFLKAVKLRGAIWFF